MKKIIQQYSYVTPDNLSEEDYVLIIKDGEFGVVVQDKIRSVWRVHVLSSSILSEDVGSTLAETCDTLLNENWQLFSFFTFFEMMDFLREKQKEL